MLPKPLNFLKKTKILLSNIYFSYKKKSKDISNLKTLINSGAIKKIYFNRTDRIGDAIVCLPLFIEIQNKITNFEIVFLTSKYNDWVLNPFVKTKTDIFNDKEDYTLFELLIDTLKHFIYNKRLEKLKTDLFIDLKGDLELSEKYNNNYILSYKNYILNKSFSDFIANDFYVYGSYDLLSIKIKKTIEYLFDVKIYPEEYPIVFKNYLDRNYNNNISNYISNNFIIFYVGNKTFRNLSAENWCFLINRVLFKGKIVIVDDTDRNIIDILRKNINNNNVIFLDNGFSLHDLAYLSSKSKLLIGLDGGGFNYMQTTCNSFLILGSCDEFTWRPFSNNEYILYLKSKNNIIEYTNTANKLKKFCYYYNQNFFKYTYEMLKLPNFSNQVIDFDFLIKGINRALSTCHKR